MTPQMEEFLKEFAELLEKHEVEFEIFEKTSGWEAFSDGINIWQDRVYNTVLDNTAKGFCEIKLPTGFDSVDIKGFIKENR